MMVKTKCSVHKASFAIIFVDVGGGKWEAQEANELSEDRAQGGYGQDTITGQMLLGANYPGCPHCGNMTFFLCNKCGTVNCQGSAVPKPDGHTYVDCANCGPVGHLTGSIESLTMFDDL